MDMSLQGLRHFSEPTVSLRSTRASRFSAADPFGTFDATPASINKGGAIAKPSAAQQIDGIASAFSLTNDPNDIHGPTVRDQLLSSYIEWLEAERRLASTELWPQMPEGLTPPDKQGVVRALIPANTRWGGWHYNSLNFPAMKWCDRPHPVTRAALVLWTVGAIDDIPDPLRDLFAAYTEAMTCELRDDSDQACDEHQANVLTPIRERILSTTLAPTTMAGAAALLRFVLRDLDGAFQASEVEIAAIEAVIRFLDREEPAPSADAERPQPHVRPDDALWAIERWREARVKFNGFGDDTPDDDPAFRTADEAEVRCWDRMIRVVPTTHAGLTAWTAVVNEPANRERVDQAGDIETVLDTMARAAAAIEERRP